MMFLIHTYISSFVIGYLLCLEVIPERPQVDYVNKKYLKSFNLSIGKRSRRSPYYINLELDTICGVGNNLTISMLLLEFLSGRYIPTLVQGSYKLCDFLYKEPFLGQMYAKQIKGNWSCPFPAGIYHFHDFVIHLENFPFTIPFTWSSLGVQTRADIEGYMTSTKETVFKLKTYATVTQKPNKPK